MSAQVKIVTYIPADDADSLRKALGNAGAGQLGEYTFCSFSTAGTGRYLPSDKAHPHIGQPGSFESVQEERIEVTCDREKAKTVLGALKATHPYEEVAYDIYPLLGEDEL